MPVAGNKVIHPNPLAIFQVEQQRRALIQRKLLQLFPQPLEKHPFFHSPCLIRFRRSRHQTCGIFIVGKRFDRLIADSLDRSDRTHQFIKFNWTTDVVENRGNSIRQLLWLVALQRSDVIRQRLNLRQVTRRLAPVCFLSAKPQNLPPVFPSSSCHSAKPRWRVSR